jgi:hypothetical protein
MSPAVSVLTIVISISAVVLVLVLVRRQRLKERFAVTWLVVTSGMVLLAVFRPLLDRLSDELGIQSGTTTVFLLAVLVILGVQLQLSVAVSRLEERLRDLAEAVALKPSRTTQRSGGALEEADKPDREPEVSTEDGIHGP